MRLKNRSIPAWLLSILLHALLFLVAFPPGGGSAAEGMEIVGVDVLALNGTAEQAAPAGPVVQEPKAPLADGSEKRPVQDASRTPKEPAVPATAQPRAKEPVPQHPGGPAAGRTGRPDADSGKQDGAGTGGGRGVSYGSGDGYVLERPVYYPKNAQNEGAAGRVQLAIILDTSGSVRAEMLQSSGDDRLDSYSLRAVAEAWKYRAPETRLRIRVSIIFENSSVKVIFEGAEPFAEEASQP